MADVSQSTSEATVDSNPAPEAEVEGQEAASEPGEAEAQVAEADTTGDGESAEDSATEEEKPGVKQAKSIFAQLHDEEFGEKAPTAEELPEGVKPESRAARTIIDLRQRAQRAEQEITNFQAAMQQREQEVGSYLVDLNFSDL